MYKAWKWKIRLLSSNFTPKCKWYNLTIAENHNYTHFKKSLDSTALFTTEFCYALKTSISVVKLLYVLDNCTWNFK